ncbi:MBL fold metallo-hydrolase [Ferruginibacter yonginensis]|uniref:MBL fold metallo-hydrolase n=1 Tax=Ferruginibacter yonginensis TaxID=1310416 RepID=A0ABV8QQD9_9BACT
MLTVKSFEFSPIQENTYVLYNEFNECIIIDPGCYFDSEKEALSQFITQKQLTPKLLVNTHCHLDHVFGNKYVAEQYQLILHIHTLEKQVLDFAPASGLMYNMPFDNYSGAFIYITENDTLSIGDDVLKIFFTPGHSPGSVSFYNEAGGFVIGGDVLFKNSIGRTDLPGGNYEQLIQSIQTQLMVLPNDTKVYSGHGPVTTIGAERLNNPFLQ